MSSFQTRPIIGGDTPSVPYEGPWPNNRMEKDLHNRYAIVPASHAWRVCRTWHETSRVKVPAPGVRRAEG